MGRRVLALSIDWAAALLVSYAFFAADNTATLLIFAAQSFILTALTGSSFGHRITGLRLQRLDGEPVVGFAKAGLRIALILLVLPAVILGQRQSRSSRQGSRHGSRSPLMRR
jgi:uncharacterized RDD family membrane protein YckC